MKFKKLLAVLGATIMVAGSMVVGTTDHFNLSNPMTVSATSLETSEDGLYQYQVLWRDEIMIVDYYGSDNIVEIPAQIDGYNVTYLSEGMFTYCENRDMEQIILPEGLTNISSSVFSNLKSLKSVSIPSTVKAIGPAAFSDCESLETIILPEQVTVITSRMFEGCTSLRSIETCAPITRIEGEAFTGTAWLKQFTDRNELAIFDGFLVDGSTYNESKLTIPSNVNEICASAFAGNTTIEEVHGYENLHTIREYAFMDCTNLKTIQFSNNLTYMGIEAFKNTNLTSFVNEERMNPSLLIGSDCFKGTPFIEARTSISKDGLVIVARNLVTTTADLLVDTIVPYGVTQVSRYAFKDNGYRVHTLVLPRSIRYIDNDALTGLTQTTDLTVKSSQFTIGSSNKLGKIRDIYACTDELGELLSRATGAYSASLITPTVGDVNGDLEFSIADLTRFKKYLLGQISTIDFEQGDLTEDFKINVFDFVAMQRRALNEE